MKFGRIFSGTIYGFVASALVGGQAAAGVLFQDDFNGSSVGADWTVDAGEGGATFDVTGGLLNFNTGVVTGLDPRPQKGLQLTGGGAPSITPAADWTVEAAIQLGMASDFDVTASGEGIAFTLEVRDPAGGGDNVQVNGAGLNFGSGFGHAARAATRTADTTVSEQITPIGDGSADLDLSLRISYTQTTGLMSFGWDSGSGFTAIASPLDVSTWGMAPTDVFEITMDWRYVSLADEPQPPPASTFSVENGEAAIDQLIVHDVALPTGTIPEPSALLLLCFGIAGTLIRRRR